MVKNKKFGKKAVDKTTGFVGVVTAFFQDDTGREEYRLEGLTDAGPISRWFQSEKLTFLTKPKKKKK